MPTTPDFGPIDPGFMPGAINAVGTCLAVQPGETVALVADEPSRGVAASLARALDDRGATVVAIKVEDLAARPIRRPPEAVVDAFERCDAGILCLEPREGELSTRMAIVSIVERRRVRYAHMIGVTPEIMRQGMRTDYRLVDRLCDALGERLRRARSLRVTTPGGTSFTATFDPALAWVKTSGLISPRYWSNLPAGEVFTTPGSVDGTFVCDATVGDYFGVKYGDLEPAPMVLVVEKGRLVSARSDRKDLEREFWDYCHTDANSDRVGELAFGTNLGVSEMIGVLLQDEKVPGVHIAFGDPYGSQTGADWKSTTHVDVLTRRCDVWIDEEPVMKEGRYLLGVLGIDGRMKDEGGRRKA
jgi:leucyl aminopeptidase (aminopeptidase T)